MKNYKERVLQGIVLIVVISTAFNYLDSKSKVSKEVVVQRNDVDYDKRRSEEAAQFLLDASEINLEQISLGKLAQQKGNKNDTKALGKRMESEHANSNNVLNALLKTKSIILPTSQTESGLNAYQKLNHKSGIDFDKTYAAMMVSQHKYVLSLFETASLECLDPEIKAWANASLPSIRTNLEQAITCQNECNKI
jgi:putative membrane protein